jgi:hypothetical protein
VGPYTSSITAPDLDTGGVTGTLAGRALPWQAPRRRLPAGGRLQHHGLGQDITATGPSRGQTLAVPQSPCIKDGGLRYR